MSSSAAQRTLSGAEMTFVHAPSGADMLSDVVRTAMAPSALGLQQMDT